MVATKTNSRIKLEMGATQAFRAVSEDNPGALSVLLKSAEVSPRIDPKSALGPLAAVMLLDGMEIYGSDIWVLYKDVCRQKMPLFLGLLRACQLGIASIDQVKEAIKQGRGSSLNVKEVVEKLCQVLPSFKFEDDLVPTGSVP